MAINPNLLRRPSDRSLFLIAAITFPLLILIGYFKSYYFSHFFGISVTNDLVHAHGLIMTLWVVYFTVQIALARSKNYKLHMTLGMAGIGLAALVVVVGLATAYDSHLVRRTAPPGMNPHSFFLFGVMDMLLFSLFLGGAIYWRKRPAEHKTLMLLTAINFLPAALARIPVVPPHLTILWAFGMPELLAIVCLIWHSRKHGKLNKVFAAGVALLIASHPLRFILCGTQTWLDLVALIAP